MNGTNILTISGWTQPADALLPLAPDADVLDYAGVPSVEALADRLEQSDYDVVIGWSLGGIIARQLIQRGALKSKLLVSLAAPYQFVRNDTLQEAMPPDMFQQFYQNYAQDPERTSKRFHGLLAKGDAEFRRVIQELGHHPQVLETERWLPWMDYLETYSAAEHDYSRLPPTLIIHGEQDAIIPFTQAKLLKNKFPRSQLITLPESGHAPHHHAPAYIKHTIHEIAKALL